MFQAASIGTIQIQYIEFVIKGSEWEHNAYKIRNHTESLHLSSLREIFICIFFCFNLKHTLDYKI